MMISPLVDTTSRRFLCMFEPSVCNEHFDTCLILILLEVLIAVTVPTQAS